MITLPFAWVSASYHGKFGRQARRLERAWLESYLPKNFVRWPPMFLDVVDLRNFYSQPLGIVARRLLSRAIPARWPNTRGQALVGPRYATPYLGAFRAEVERTF